jgi:hypothetical protein
MEITELTEAVEAIWWVIIFLFVWNAILSIAVAFLLGRIDKYKRRWQAYRARLRPSTTISEFPGLEQIIETGYDDERT